MSDALQTGVVWAIQALIILAPGLIPLAIVPGLVYVERRMSAFIQDRIGPNRVGPLGLLQPVADALKFIFKEDIVPPHAHRWLYILAPAFAAVPALCTLAVVPLGHTLHVFGREIALIAADVNVGILVVFGLTSLGVYGIVLAGWASNNKYSLLGGLRSSAQMISYELSLGLSVIGVIMLAGSLRLTDIVMMQDKLNWFVFLQPIGAIVFLIASYAETNRLPFDLPEAETELVAGYHTEYGSMKFALFFLGEYAAMITASALTVTLFFGGWQLPYYLEWSRHLPQLLADLIPPAVFAFKTLFFLFLMIWVRWTFPRFRYDQLMDFGWKVMLPAALLNIAWTAVIILAGWV
ncbi:MAG TPA: NADH-quinone oxidoreductase subunit NuoH [Thermodesulfobacteriota bacterium]